MKKKTIAYLTRSLTDASGVKMWQGIVDSCNSKSMPLITFNGAELNKSKASILYHLFQPSKFAGVISWASSDVTAETVNFYNNFGETPLICMSFQIPGHPVILTDCKVGVEQVVDHLVKVHKFTKIAFIRGPEAHVYARDRYQGYLSALRRNKIRLDERLVTPNGGWSIKDGQNGIDYLLNNGLKPKTDFEAVICVGDNVAIGAQEYLQSKGYSIPHDVAVCGFNGSIDALFCNPPITTVNMPFYGLGTKSFEMVDTLARGERLPNDKVSYQSSIIIGQSCGCTSKSFEHAYCTIKAPLDDGKAIKKGKAIIDEEYLNSNDFVKSIAEKFVALAKDERSISPEIISFLNSKIPGLVGEYVKIINTEDSSAFFVNLDLVLNDFVPLSEDLSLWQDFASLLRNESLHFADPKHIFIIENTSSQMRVYINEFNDRIQRLVALKNSRQESILRDIGSALLTSYDSTELMNIIAKSISKLNIPGCYVVLYNDSKYTEENPVVSEKSRVILAVHDNSRINLPPEGIEFETTDILPDSLFPDNYSMVVLSLHFQDTFMGYIVFEQSKTSAAFYNALRDQLSCSLYGALLQEENDRVKRSIQSTLSVMNDKAEIASEHSQQVSQYVSTVSKEMDNVAKNIREISANLETVMETVNTANRDADTANTAMTELVDDTKKISRAVRNIGAIAERTNVLALNASIEAAHAGEAGKGFSIVAKEVKNLAAQTVSATEHIQELVEANNEKTSQTERIFNATTEAIRRISTLSNRIQASIDEQVNTSAEISSQLQQASNNVEDVSTAITELAKLK